MDDRIQTLAQFYPYYLGEHRNGACRICHFVGSSTVLFLIGWLLWTGNWSLAWVLPFAGYGPAWFGHGVFEKNKPATFKYPLWSFLSDWIMMKDMLTGRLPFLGELDPEVYATGETSTTSP